MKDNKIHSEQCEGLPCDCGADYILCTKCETNPCECKEKCVWEDAYNLIFKCIAPGCDNNGSIAHQVGEDEWEQEQCQFCDEKRFPVKDFIKELLEEKEKEHQKVIKGILESFENYFPEMESLGDEFAHYRLYKEIKDLLNK